MQAEPCARNMIKIPNDVAHQQTSKTRDAQRAIRTSARAQCVQHVREKRRARRGSARCMRVLMRRARYSAADGSAVCGAFNRKAACRAMRMSSEESAQARAANACRCSAARETHAEMRQQVRAKSRGTRCA